MVGDNQAWGEVLNHLDGKGVFMGASDPVGPQPTVKLPGWGYYPAGDGPVVLPFKAAPPCPDINLEFNQFLKEQLKAEVLSRQGWTGKCEGLREENTRLKIALAETVNEIRHHNQDYFVTPPESITFWEATLREGVGK